VVLLVGTMKGAFVARSGPERAEWTIDGPFFRGRTVYSLAFDQRGGSSIAIVAAVSGG
jgi:hypothetical protein